MVAEFFLANKYFKEHRRQCIGAVLACSLFIAAFITTLIFRESFLATIDYNNARMFGNDVGIVYNADAEIVQENISEIQSSGSGVIQVQWSVETGFNGREFYIGSMDSDVIRLRMLELQEGRYAENAGELAIEYSALNALFPDAKCGDTLTVNLNKDGEVSAESYVLVGILDDYTTQWQRTDASKSSIIYPPPSLIVIDDGQTSTYTHVVCSDIMLGKMLGGMYSENSHYPIDLGFAYQKTVLNAFVIPIFLFFVAVMAFGIVSIVLNTMKERKQYLKLLRCIGMKKRKGVLMFLVQATQMFITSTIVGTLLSIALSIGIITIVSIFGNNLIYTVSFFCFWPAWLVAACTIFTSFMVSVGRFFSKMPLETGRDKIHPSKCDAQKAKNAKKLWQGSVARQHRYQNLVAVMLVAACLFVTVFGGIMAFYLPWEENGGLESRSKDYTLYVYGGAANPENFYITLPRGTGVSQKDLDALRKMDALQVISATVRNMTSHFILYAPESEIPYFEDLISQDYALKDTNTAQLSAVIEQVGGTVGNLLVEPPFIGMDYGTVINAVQIIDGAIDKENFLAGNEIIAPDTFSVGDSFLLVTPLLADESAPQGSMERFTFATKNVTVSAVYNSAEGSHFVYSAEAIMAVDVGARYEYLELKNLLPNDDTATNEIESLLDRITARSTYTNMENLIERQREYEQDLRNGQILIAASVAIFIAVVTFAIAYSVNIKIRAALRSYMLMRAIGAKNETIVNLIRADTTYIIMTGSVIGAVLGVAVFAWWHRSDLAYLPYWSIVPWVLTAAAVVVYALWFLVRMAMRKPIASLLEENIATALSAVEI